jgi:biopolymer transport protein ExbD
MPKVKLPRKGTTIDMTAMCDVAFLLLTFFMLATKFKPDEPVIVKTPASISEIPLPDVDIMLLTVDPKGRIFFSMDNKKLRQDLINVVNDERKLGLTDQEKMSFAIGSSIGVPFSQLKAFLNTTGEDQKNMIAAAPGVPADTSVTNPNNELAIWIRDARNTNGKLRICIKADGDASYPSINKIIKTLAGWKIFKFNLITNLKEIPKGSAAYEMQHAGEKK